MAPQAPHSNLRPRRPAVALAGLALALGLLLCAAAPASAHLPRTYESRLSIEPGPPERLTFDSANRLWGDEPSGFGSQLYEVNPLGEKLPLTVHIGAGGSLTIDYSNNDLYDPQNGEVVVYSAAGLRLSEIIKEGHLAIAADNSSKPTAGRLYLTRTPVEGGAPLNIVELLGENGEPITFPRYKEPSPPSYISANTLTGTPAGPFTSPHAVAVGPEGELYVADAHAVDEFEPSGVFLREISGGELPVAEFKPANLAVDPTTADLVVTDGSAIYEFDPSGTYLGQLTGSGPSEATPFAGLNGVAVNSAGFLYAAAGTAIDVFSPTFILPKVSYPGVSAATEVSPTEASATLGAEVDPRGGGVITSCEFEYVEEAEYRPSAANPFEAGHSAACEQALPYSGSAPLSVSADLTGLTPGVVYHYRALVGNENGTTEMLAQTFDLQPPTVKGLSSSNLTETTADLQAGVNPDGGETRCRFEYGTTTAYGQSAPCPHAAGLPAEDIGSLGAEQALSVHLEGLQQGVVYHFRLVAENPFGTTTTEDQSFNFFPPSCPNAQLRQQTGTGFLPDRRAYELVSPSDAGGTILLAEGPQSPLATSPSRFAFGGILGKIPGAGGNPPDAEGDLYVSTRTDSGWVTHYVGIPGTQRLEVNGPPNEPAYALGIEGSPSGVLGDLSMDRFMDWAGPYNGYAMGQFAGPGSYAPYLWDAEGDSLGRLPSNLATYPCGIGHRIDAGRAEEEKEQELCGEERGETLVGAVQPSPDFSHYFFSSTAALPFTSEALAKAPGSAYDDDIAKGTVQVISKKKNGTPINSSAEHIEFPYGAASTDGSHVLMSTPGPEGAVQLYMRVGGGLGVTYEIASPHAVHYVGMTPDGSKVYFTSKEHLSAEDEDSSENLYMWSEQGELKGHPLTLLSKPDGSAVTGTPSCPVTTWTTGCGAVALPPPSSELADRTSILYSGLGGNGHSDNFIAALNGDIYFYSPQQLDGAKGILGQRNLYDYRAGEVRYVTTLQGPIVRIQVSPEDSHMAFLTASQVTSYDNAGQTEMYAYDPSTEAIHCVSCVPDGAPPTSNVEASDNGLFMTDDGRIFFSTADPLVPQDTDGIRDVYEFVDGRPQLISSGTGSRERGINVGSPSELSKVGLIGVSANGTDAYFSTYDTLVAGDRNGSSLKFYDARTDGGFSEPPAAAPCAAADECAGPGSVAAPAPQHGTRAEFGTGGNILPAPAHRRHKHRHRKRRAAAHHRHHARPAGHRGEK